MAKLEKGINDLETVNPVVADQWDYEANRGLKDGKGNDISTPDKVTANSGQTVYWTLPYDVPMNYPFKPLRGKHFDFKWEAVVKNRNKGAGCPYLSNPAQAVWKGWNDLVTRNPTLAAEWDYEANKELKDENGRDISTPDKVTEHSGQTVGWLLPYDVPTDYPIVHLRGRHYDFKWEATVKGRATGDGCPYLSGIAAWKGFNDLETVNPKLASEWNYEANKGLTDGNGRDISTPDKVSAVSRQMVHWKRPYDIPMDYPIEHLRGKHFDFEWDATIAARNNGSDCPYLTGHAVWPGFNDLATTHPELAAQWDYDANRGLRDKFGRDISTPDKVSAGSKLTFHWILPYDVPMDYPIKHLRGRHYNFKWEATMNSRTADRGCPYLSGRAVWRGFNDLETVNPELALEWDYEANKGLKDEKGKDISTPNKITAGSGQKVGWIYHYFDKDTENYIDFKWKAEVKGRSRGSGCPFVISSKGEKAVRKILNSQNIIFKEQNTFKDRFYTSPNNPLRDDFAIFNTNSKIIATIEFNGKQHYEVVDFSGKDKKGAEIEFKRIQERDKIKSDYLKTHGIKQLIVPYTEFDNVEQIVKDFLSELSKDFDLYPQKQEENQKSWIPPQDKPSKKEVKAFMQKLIKGDVHKQHSTSKEKIVAKNTNDLSIDL